MHLLRAVAYAVVLIAKTPGLLIRFVRQRRAGVRTFRRELLNSGLDPAQAEELTLMYKTIVVPEWKVLFRSRTHAD